MELDTSHVGMGVACIAFMGSLYLHLIKVFVPRLTRAFERTNRRLVRHLGRKVDALKESVDAAQPDPKGKPQHKPILEELPAR